MNKSISSSISALISLSISPSICKSINLPLPINLSFSIHITISTSNYLHLLSIGIYLSITSRIVSIYMLSLIDHLFSHPSTSLSVYGIRLSLLIYVAIYLFIPLCTRVSCTLQRPIYPSIICLSIYVRQPIHPSLPPPSPQPNNPSILPRFSIHSFIDSFIHPSIFFLLIHVTKIDSSIHLFYLTSLPSYPSIHLFFSC